MASRSALVSGSLKRSSFPAFRATMALVLREMATRYGRSPGGYVWAVLEPLGAIIILTLGFSLLMRDPPLGSSFMLFYAAGYMPFTLYLSISNMVSRAIKFSRPLLHYPAVTWVDALLARFILNALTGLLVTIILLPGIVAVTDTRVVVNLPPMLLAMVLALLLGGGVGTLNCALNSLFPAWEQIWSIATRPLFIVSGIFFLYDTMPSLLRDILWYNPLIHIIGLMRKGFYPTYRADYITPTYVIAIGLITLFFGVLLMGRYHRDILNSD